MGLGLNLIGSYLWGDLWKPMPPVAPQLACVYAFEMSDDTVKIGLSENPDNRAKQVAGAVFLDVKRIYHTGYAPRSFMYSIESTCHAKFADRRVRGEFFAIPFEEAVAELDSHADEVATALKTADEKFLRELAYWERMIKQKSNVPALPGSSENKVVYVEAPPVGQKSFQLITVSAGRYILTLVNEDLMVVTAGEFSNKSDAQTACNMMASILTKYCGEDSFVDVGFSKNKPTMSFKDFVEATLAKPCCLVVKNEQPVKTIYKEKSQ